MARTLARRAGPVAMVVAGAALLILLIVAAFPWGLLAGRATGPIAAALGRPVTVASGHRIDWFSLEPTVELRGVVVPQPDWAGPGDLARIGRARIRFAALPLLIGRFRPRAIDLDDVTLDLRRDASGRSNWDGKPGPHRGSPPSIAHLAITGGSFRLIDVKRHVLLRGTLRSDPAGGLVVDGTGTQRGQPLSVAVRGDALGAVDPRAPYRLRVSTRSPLVSVDARMLLDHPLDTARFTADVEAHGQDIRYLDDIVQAGLFPSQDFRLTGTVRHDAPNWRIERVAGTVGRSVLAGTFTVGRDGDRTKLDGEVNAKTFDFADFASDVQQARGEAKKAAIGKRLIPDTRITLENLVRLDGRVHLRAARLLGSEPFVALDTVATLDHGRLVLEPLTAGLKAGRAIGRVVVDARQRTPDLLVDARVEGSTIQSLLLDDGSVEGPLRARIRLEGHGDTVRQAIGRASGSTGLSVPSGTVRRDYATFAGGDVLKSAGVAVSGGDGRVALRCLVARFDARDGVLTPDPLVLDTALARSDGSGRVTLADEAIDLKLVGAPKHPGLLVSKAPIRVYGTLADPKLDVTPPQAQRQGKTGTLDRIGFFLKKIHTRGDETPPAQDADCAGLAARALR